jgi:hypothetical protein
MENKNYQHLIYLGFILFIFVLAIVFLELSASLESNEKNKLNFSKFSTTTEISAINTSTDNSKNKKSKKVVADKDKKETNKSKNNKQKNDLDKEDEKKKKENKPKPKTGVIDQEVPFTPQAPFADWEDPRQQDGCEEASVLMTIKWARGGGLNKQQALETILDMAKFQQENYGYYTDTSASSTISHIIKGYFDYNHAQLESEVNRENIIEALENDKLVIVPTNGKKLNNPYFSGDGPERHMLVIRGFDFETEEFIVNDPGTRRGEAFRYSVENLLNSIRDYPSGKDKKITKIEQNMIVFSKSN